MLARIAQPLVDTMSIQIAVLGSGEPWLEGAFKSLTAANPGKIGSYIGYDNELSHLIEAGSDFFLMPSRFEPCGLNQMYSMRYGTLPVVRSTGGLADTVSQYVEGTGQGDGFLFDSATCDALYNTIGWACSTWYDRPSDILSLRRNAMNKDFSWEVSAKSYEQVYIPYLKYLFTEQGEVGLKNGNRASHQQNLFSCRHTFVAAANHVRLGVEILCGGACLRAKTI